MAETIFVEHDLDTFKAYYGLVGNKTGWYVMYLDKDGNSHQPENTVYPHKKNAYRRARQLNYPIKHAIKKTGLCEAYFDGYTAYASQEDEGYSLKICKDGMPPHWSGDFATVDEIDAEMKNNSFFPRTVQWRSLDPEDC